MFNNSVGGTVKLRRVDNIKTSGNFSLVWSEFIEGDNSSNMFTAYENDMEVFFSGNTYNKGSDNIFDNYDVNSNNIERFDWIVADGFSVADPTKNGIAVFDRGPLGQHDAFKIAAITSLDEAGNPETYGNIVSVITTDYGDPTPNIRYQIFKAPYPANLMPGDEIVIGEQPIGGVIIHFSDLGMAASSTIYGYSIFSNDLPGIATPSDLVDYTNTTFFPLNTGETSGQGGLDMLAVTGVFTESSVMPVNFTHFNATENNKLVSLRWEVGNENSLLRYEVERSTDGIHFRTLGVLLRSPVANDHNTYKFLDDLSHELSHRFYYRIKQYDLDNSFYYSNTLVIITGIHPDILIYPNPTQSFLYLSIPATSHTVVNIAIMNATGTQVLNKIENLMPGRNSILINTISPLPTGEYTIRIHLPDNKIISRKILKI